MSVFTPITGLFGGFLIGAGAGTLMLFGGQILGASGLISSLILHPKETLTKPENQWKAGLLGSFLVVAKVWATYCSASYLFDSVIATDPGMPVVSAVGHAVAGFLVGFGTKLGNGCTSGHGICGMPRMSLRSYVNVMCFMGTGFLTASLCGPGCSLAEYLRSPKSEIPYAFPTDLSKSIADFIIALIVGSVIPALLSPIVKEGKTTQEIDAQINNKRKHIPAILAGGLFSIGLAISGMIKTDKIFGFLDLSGFKRGTWDATLLFVMGGGFFVNLICYQFVKGYNLLSSFPKKQLECPIALKPSVGKFSIPTNKIIDAELVLGGLIFGVGWGIGGICPGPALWLGAAGFKNVLAAWWPFYILGSYSAEKARELRVRWKK